MFISTSNDSYIAAPLYHLMGVYANLIYKNWSYHATRTTKIKKPYLEKLIVRNLHAELIPLFGMVGLFQKLSGVGVISQLIHKTY